jgi:hypothetical protein
MQNHENEHVRCIGQDEARGINLMADKLETVHMTNLPL